jgi:hypothetical protein
MRTRNRIVNPEQQAWNRNYRRETSQYDRDEERDFENGVDYISRSGRPRGDYENRDYSPRNWWERKYREQAPYSEQLYAPSRDYGYERDEYYDMDPSRIGGRHGEATGYGNDYSPQGRDFEDWLHNSHRHRNYTPEDFRAHRFPGSERDEDERNFDFEEGLYDYQQEQRFNEGRYRKDAQGRGGHRRRQREYIDHKFHNRSDRHLEIVRPFKEPAEYGRNDYNRSEGFGRNEMVYHDNNRNDW